MTGTRHELPLGKALTSSEWGATLAASTGGKLSVTTSQQKWAYAMILPLPDCSGPGTLIVEVEISKGQIGISIANADQNRLGRRYWLAWNEGRNTTM